MKKLLLLLLIVTLVIQGCNKENNQNKDLLRVPISFSGTQITNSIGQLTREGTHETRVDALVAGSLIPDNWNTLYTYVGSATDGGLITSKAYGNIEFNITAGTATTFPTPMYYPVTGDSVYVKALAPYKSITNIEQFGAGTDLKLKFKIDGKDDVMATGHIDKTTMHGVGSEKDADKVIKLKFERLLSKLNILIADVNQTENPGDNAAETFWGKIIKVTVEGVTEFDYDLGADTTSFDKDAESSHGDLVVFESSASPKKIGVSGDTTYVGSIMIYPREDPCEHGESSDYLAYWVISIESTKGHRRVLLSTLKLQAAMEYDILLQFYKTAVVKIGDVVVQQWKEGENEEIEIE